MKMLAGLVMMFSLFVLIPNSWAGLVPTDNCTEAQIAVQDAVVSGEPFRNHGKLVKTAAHTANPYLESEQISEECHSCIVSQFARRIPIGEQEICTAEIIPEGEACGEDTNGGCNTVTPEFGAIECGQTIAGTAWADGGTRDTDWYLINLPDTGGNGMEVLTATLVSNFEGLSFVLDIGNPMCSSVMIEGTFGCSDNGVPIQDASATLSAPGTYVIFVATGMCNGGGIFDGLPCSGEENNYELSVECSDVP